MKKYFLFTLIAFSFIYNDTQAQKKEAVQILNSGSRAVTLLGNYFNDGIVRSLMTQFSPARLEDVKKYSNESSYPICFRSLIGQDNEKEEGELFQSLKAYRIAKFDNIRNGENFGEQSILMVPASENKNLMGSDCEFEESFYIIIYSKDIEVLE